MKIIITEPFGRKLKKLRKKYPHITDDLKELLSEMEEGKAEGDSVPGLFDKVFKIRVSSSDMKRGKRGGFRIVYYLENQNCEIFLLTIYAKAKTENIPARQIRAILTELESEFPPEDQSPG